MQKITSNLWFDTQAKDASRFYTSVFKGGRVLSESVIYDTPSGTVDIITIELLGQEFTLINGGPLFKLNPSVSYLVPCASKEEVDALWAKLSQGGAALMELGSYPFSERYGWIQDKYGLSWQIMFMGGAKIKQRIIPTLMFVGKVCGRAEEAIKFYTQVFHQSSIGGILRYEQGESLDKAGTIKHAAFTIEGQEFAAMDSAYKHNFAFNEAISFIVHCRTQKEIDYYWEKLSNDPSAEQCGWLKDKFGFSWQIVPIGMDEMLKSKDKTKLARVTKAFLSMKKLDIAKLNEAYSVS